MTDELLVRQDGSLAKIAEHLPVGSLLRSIDHPHLWKMNTWRQDDAWGQQDTEAIMFRWADDNSFARVRDSVSVVETGLFEKIPDAKAIVDEALAHIEATELGRVFVVKLKSGGRVYPHADVGVYSDKFERFHVCLQADDGFRYYTQHPMGPVQWCGMQAGDVWWFNHKRMHWAHNGGTIDRISIVLDCVAPKWKRKRDVIALRTYDRNSA